MVMVSTPSVIPSFFPLDLQSEARRWQAESCRAVYQADGGQARCTLVVVRFNVSGRFRACRLTVCHVVVDKLVIAS